MYDGLYPWQLIKRYRVFRTEHAADPEFQAASGLSRVRFFIEDTVFGLRERFVRKLELDDVVPVRYFIFFFLKKYFNI